MTMKIQRINLDWEKRQYLALTIDNAFSSEEVADLIARSEEVGYELARVNIGSGIQREMTDYRNSDRCIIDDPAVAALLWSRIQKACNELDADEVERLNLQRLFQPKRGWYPVGLNERLRFLRYGPGTYFKPHWDGTYVRENELGPERRGERSFVTCQLYLTEGARGGATTFMSGFSRIEQRVPVEPMVGRVILFQHDLLHEGSTLKDGVKYVIRTDVMYTNKGLWHEYSRDPNLFSHLNGDGEDAGGVAGDDGYRTP